ncbi:MAG: hypothetical protein SV765_17545 [Pseudomonadota bacterium]|nr:hypothetical protein [Pseudomonadales bacterium]MDY6922007.1 hypothetical protein [Pseudomonadota bacterium]
MSGNALSRHYQYQQGQAMSEFIVSMAWVIPFILMLVAIGHMINVQTETHKAARYVAWERTAYTNQDYQQRLQDTTDGFNNEVAQRFFVNGGVGFSAGATGYSKRWEDWDSDQTVVQLNDGIRVLQPDENDVNLSTAMNYLAANRGQVDWLEDNAGVEVNTAAGATLEVDFNTENTYALEAMENTPRVDSSYVLIADSWAPVSEQQYQERVAGVRYDTLARQQRWFENGIFIKPLQPVFLELRDRLYINGNDSFEMVSENQSTALPQAALEPYQP